MILSRPTKCRRVCRFPETLEFFTTGETLGEPVILTVDEYETIRPIDKEGLSRRLRDTARSWKNDGTKDLRNGKKKNS